MIFNSIDFLLFFPVVYFIYLKSPHRIQNIFLLAASYFFYGYWDPRYLSLLFISTVVDYFCSISIQSSRDNLFKKKLFLVISIASNLSILGFFKYYNFFAISFKLFMANFGLSVNPVMMNFLLPLGISFYTFQTMSYTIDVYRGNLNPTRNFLDFALYVSFFPQLVAGPIERATNLLPQVLSPRNITFNQLKEGAFLILLGYFKKIFIADNLAFIVDPIFDDPNSNGASIVFGCFVFYFQVYGDFAGYSDIARGLSKFMGFELMRNFDHPTFSVNVVDFWRRWHISFMSWLKDYVYFSIGKKDDSELKKNFNNLFVFFLSGLWHGANWTFVIWGVINGFINLGYRFIHLNFPKKENEPTSGWKYLVKRNFNNAITLTITVIPLIYFRSKDLEMAWGHTTAMFNNFGFMDSKLFTKFFKNIFLLLLVEYHQYKYRDEFSIFKLPVPVRVLLYIALFYAILILGNFDKNAFIYFVF
ncbi:MAG: MBOAT family protein [Leptospiraceae bacterium]|nr:MBOAT family protein [Leptospiraceae bacterium]